MTKFFAIIFMALAMILPSQASAYATEHHALAGWINQTTKGKVSESTALGYVRHAYESGKKWRVDPLLLLAVMKPESNYNANAYNKSGATGLMQVIPRWHKDKIKHRSIKKPSVNIDVAAQIFDEYLGWHRESYTKAIDRYSGGAKSTYGKKIKDTYRELREVTLAWKMDNDVHIDYAHQFGKPRKYTEVLAAKQPDTQGYEALMAKHTDATDKPQLLAMARSLP